MDIGEYHPVIEYNMNRIIGIDQGIIRTIEVTLEEEILERISNQIKIVEVDMKEIIEMKIMKEVEVGIGIDNILTIEEMVEATLGLDQV